MTSLTDDAYVGTLHYKILDPPVSTASHDLQATCDVGNTTTTDIISSNGDIEATTGSIKAPIGKFEGIGVDATGNIETTNGNIETTNGNIEATNGNIEATAGNITCVAGTITSVDIVATNTITSTNDITATAGDIVATAGKAEIESNITSKAGNFTADVGTFRATAGNFEAPAGDVSLGGNYIQTGTGTLTSGSGAVKLNGRIESQAGLDIPLTNDAGTQVGQNYIKNNTTFEAQVKFLGQINGTIASPEFCPVFPNAQYKTYTLDTTLPKQEYALSLLATGSAGSLMFDLHTAHGNLRQNYTFEVNSFCADEKPPILIAPYVLNWAVYPPNNGTSNTDCCIQINYTDYDASQTQVMRVDVRIFYNPSPP